MNVQWQVSSYTVSEDSGTVQLVLLKEGPTVSNVSVEVMTIASSATGMTGQAHQANCIHDLYQGTYLLVQQYQLLFLNCSDQYVFSF